MSDLDEAKRLLEKIVDANETGNTDVPNVTLALEILLKDYIQRASWAQGDLEKLTLNVVNRRRLYRAHLCERR
jgi:hypothetical protein